MMAGQKRVSDSSNVGEGKQLQFKKQKAPALPSEILEVHMVDTQQKVETCLGRIERLETCLDNIERLETCRIERLETCLGRIERLETCLGRIVSQFERAVAKLVPAMDGGRQSLKQIEGPAGRNLQLRCQSKLPPNFFTEGKVGGGVHGGEAIRVELIDKSTGNIVASGPESRVKLDVVALKGDFNHEDDDDEWTREDFENHVVKERVGKRPLLAGELKLSLKGGVGFLGDVTFTDNSSWIPCKKFGLGFGVQSGFCEGIRIREAKTNAFTVKENRGQKYEKHHPPSWDDELWRLENIRKDGSFLRKLNDNGIFKVEDFLRFLVRDSQALRKILVDGMRTKNWDALVKHAKTCVPNGKLYVYDADDMDNDVIVFDNIYQVNGLIAGGQYYSAETLSDSQKVHVDTLVKKAYANWKDIVEYDERMPLNMKQNKMASTSQTKVATGGLADYPVSFYQPAVSLPHLPPSIPSEQAFVNSWLPVGDYPVSFEQQIFVQCQPPSVSSEQAFVYPELTVEDYPISFDRQVSAPPQPLLVPSEQFLVNSELAVEGGMGSEEELCWENHRFPPPCKSVLLWLTPFYALRFLRALTRKPVA
ncbi:calmodulin-binding protein 60 C isoform X2 [Cinnamomum micranthum f. kanehirae]|uniref:Calmodulin-binding protein 60 C isoform X2 n=1 Tax=Cinnamomum micranthum f. kanehirae TaxID=337451 RepID=A0A3S3N9N7_9MAGN|nr:calmodulin-binding protein 60 C isoform X2 [Cinnamomum micranthum f. kanehirae]